jgi:ribosomal protein L37AE/L43A
MRAECTLPTNTSKPNRNTINTIEHAGTFACRVCFDLTSVECGNWRVEEKKSKSGGKFRKLVPDIERRRRQGVWCCWETEFNFQDPRYKPASAVNEDVKSANGDKFVLFMEELVRDLKTENSDTEVSYKNDDFFNMYKMVCDCFI